MWVNIRKRGKERETWWWSEGVQQKKTVAYNKWQGTREEGDREHYREKKREARREVAVAKRTAWEQWSGDLGTAGSRAKMFKVAKQMRRDRKDVEGTNFIKREDGVIKVDGAEVCERWRGYFQELLNGENECEFGQEGATLEHCHQGGGGGDLKGHEKW